VSELTREAAILKVIGKGPSFPFSFSSTGKVKSVQVSLGVEKIKQSIHMILSTRRGERVMVPEFGCFSGDTRVRIAGGSSVPISSLVGARRVEVFGVQRRAGDRFHPPGDYLFVATAQGAVSNGERETVRVTLSDSAEIRCTPGHRFLLADQQTYVEAKDLVVGNRLSWMDPYQQDFATRFAAWRISKGNRYDRPICRMPMSNRWISVVGVEEAGVCEVFDLPNSRTGNYVLDAGPVVHNSNLHSLVFEPNDEILARRLEFETGQAIKRWEKRIVVKRIVVIDPSGASTDALLALGSAPTELSRVQGEHWIGVYIEFEVLRYHVTGSYVYPFVRTPMPLSETMTGVGNG
jgi:phage baseplate assembly protein W